MGKNFRHYHTAHLYLAIKFRQIILSFEEYFVKTISHLYSSLFNNCKNGQNRAFFSVRVKSLFYKTVAFTELIWRNFFRFDSYYTWSKMWTWLFCTSYNFCSRLLFALAYFWKVSFVDLDFKWRLRVGNRLVSVWLWWQKNTKISIYMPRFTSIISSK